MQLIPKVVDLMAVSKKKFSKIINLILSIILIGNIVGCSKNQITTFQKDTTKITITSLKDVINKMTYVTTLEIKSDEEKQELHKIIEETKKKFVGIEDSTYQTEVKDNVFIETIVLDTSSKDKIIALAKQGIITVEEDEFDYISLKMISEYLKNNGWKINN